jgi:monofunctional biosynthetic peptidoglycan transglycosylase
MVSWALVLSLRWVDPPTSAFMLQDDSGRAPVLYEWTAWLDLGSAAALAVVAAEDQKFAQHFGFDLQSIQDSVAASNAGTPLRGASTITQQVAKNLFLWPGRSLLRKGIEAYFTLLIELSWPKRRILEIYLNIAELGPGIYGMGAASDTYFNQRPSSLSDEQAALLAAVLPNPKRLLVRRPSGYVRERQRWILEQMRRLRREQWLLRLN